MEKLKRKKVLGKKKKTKKQNKKKKQTQRKKEYHSVRKRKKFLRESGWYWQSSTLASRFRKKEVIIKPKFAK